MEVMALADINRKKADDAVRVARECNRVDDQGWSHMDDDDTFRFKATLRNERRSENQTVDLDAWRGGFPRDGERQGDSG